MIFYFRVKGATGVDQEDWGGGGYNVMGVSEDARTEPAFGWIFIALSLHWFCMFCMCVGGDRRPCFTPAGFARNEQCVELE